MHIKELVITGLVLCPLFLSAADADNTPAKVDCSTMNIGLDGVFTRLMPHNFTDLAAYLTIYNNDTVPHELTGVGSSGSKSGAFMAYYGPNGNKVLQPLTNIVIYAGGSYSFVPGGDHIRLYGFNPLPNPGDVLSMTFTFENGCSKSIDGVPVIDRMTSTPALM